MLTIHASCVAIAGSAVLLRGPSGAGKSDLALRLIDDGGVLVADDRTCLQRQGSAVIASSPGTIRGLLEVRGVGPIEVAYAGPSRVQLIIDLAPPDMVPRLPEPGHDSLLGVSLPCLRLNAFEASAAVKVRTAMQRTAQDKLFTPEEVRRPAQLQARQG